MDTKDKIVFLLGSGISIPAELPSTEYMTHVILRGEAIIRHTDGTYYLSDDKAGYFLTKEYVPRAKVFLERIKTEINAYYSHDSRQMNYEDLYYIVSQIRDSVLGEYDNPAIKPLIDKIYPDIKPLLDRRKNDTHDDWTLLDLAEESANYIRDVVWHSLSKEPKRLDHLNLINDACRDANISSVDICTLNHDTLLEQNLFKASIRVNDGFGPLQENGKRYWNPELLENNDFKVRLLKLHGSINWFAFTPNDKARLEEIAIPLDWDIWHTKDLIGQRQWPAGGRPKFLVGTFNKIFDCNSDIYADQQYQFHKSLRQTRCLIVCGYGFRDKGINTKIVEWVYAKSQNKLLVVHPKPNELVESARGAISNNWEDWKAEKKLHIIDKGIEGTNWSKIVSQLY